MKFRIRLGPIMPPEVIDQRGRYRQVFIDVDGRRSEMHKGLLHWQPRPKRPLDDDWPRITPVGRTWMVFGGRPGEKPYWLSWRDAKAALQQLADEVLAR